jgi:predicted lipid-binding transport protein (Tim44 family)
MMRNLLLGGLIGAGLATVFGAGAFANVLGFLLQAVLIGGLVYLAVAFFRSRMSGKPAFASAGAGQNPYQAHLDRQAVGAGGGAAVSKTLDITGDDYSAFERLLGEIQGAYGRGDTDALGARATPEMLSYFARELDDNKRNGMTNVLGVPKLLQGDLSEAWREAGGEYATVAMRYSLTDAMVDRAGKVVSGSTTTPDEVTEVWTFRRRAGSGPSGWELSAIQQA